jgi:hypothetical protein
MSEDELRSIEFMNVAYCGACGAAMPETCDRSNLIEHIKACEKHPLHEALAEVARLRERAERAERERDALTKASLTQYSNGRWGASLGNYALGAFDSRDAAIREIFECAGLDAAPAGAEIPP